MANRNISLYLVNNRGRGLPTATINPEVTPTMANGFDRGVPNGSGAIAVYNPPPAGVCAPVASAGGPCYMRWEPGLGDCPTDISRLLCWLWKSYCSFNRFGKLGTSRSTTTPLHVPHGVYGFSIGPEGAAQACGVFFPHDWIGEAVFRAVYRVKASPTVYGVAGGMDPGQIANGLENNLEFRIIQVGSQDNFHSVLNFGDAQDASKSTDTPSQGGFWLPEGNYFVPFGPDPAIQAYDFRGIAPGGAGDAYDFFFTIISYFAPIC